MIDIATLSIGQKVHYIPYEGCQEKEIQNGIVKEIHNSSLTQVYVVYRCMGDWKNYKNYTSQLTPVSKLRLGWFFHEIEAGTEDHPTDNL